MTVTGLARACGLSRTAVLYYESVGLLKPGRRSRANYRLYGERELERLRRIVVYRRAGLKLADIRSILGEPRGDAAAVLQRRMAELNAEIEMLREHQRAVARLLKQTGRLEGAQMVTKEKWVAVMRGAGFSDEDMRRWHSEFEQSAPDEHQEFLEFLHLPQDEILSIREWSRKGSGDRGRG
jgi:MerR family transcriptional regulator, thiopeptide resistance regulator